MPSLMKQYDLIVIGTGGGIKIALPAAADGRQVALIEEDRAGGTCLNRGCIPSKMLIYPNELAMEMRHAERIDVHLPAPPHVDFKALVERTNSKVDGISASLIDTFASVPNLDFYPSHAEFVADKSIRVEGQDLTADRIVIATGSRPAILPIPGLEGTPYMTSADALRRTDLPRNLLLIGAGYIATEIGFAYASAGCDVQFIVRSRFLRQEDDEIASEFARVFSRHHTIHQPAHPQSVNYRDGLFHVHCGASPDAPPDVLTGDALLVATGVTPNGDRLGLANTGIETDDKGFIKVDPYLQTAVAGVYALGDVVGHHLYRHTANYEGDYLYRTAFAGAPRAPLDYGPVPHAVFAYPEIAGVGARENDLRSRGIDYVVGRATYAESNQGLARGLDHGLCKLLVDRASQRILGAHILGDEASDMIHLFIVLMKKNGTLDDILDTIFIHPALPEIARDAARDARANF